MHKYRMPSNLVETLEWFCILAGTLPLAAGYFQIRWYPGVVFCLAVGAFWILAARLSWSWAAWPGLLVLAAAAAGGILLGFSPLLMAFSLLGILSAWDLQDFNRRLRKAAPGDDLRGLEKSHLLRLALLDTSGLALMLAAVNLHIRINFEWVFLLVLVLVLGMLELVKRLRRGG